MNRPAFLLGSLLWLFAPASFGETDAMRHARTSYELSRSGELEQAEAEMKQAIAAEPRNALFHSALGGILSRRGKLAEARASFERAVELDGNPALRLQLALKQWETGELGNAYDNLLLLVSQNRSDEKALAMLKSVSLDWGAVLGKERRFKAGLAVAKETSSRFPESAAAWQMLGFFETKNQQNVLATTSYERAFRLDPDCVDCVIGLAVAQAAAGRDTEATRSFEDALQRWPEHALLHQAYGVHLLRISHEQPQVRTDATDHLRKALGMDSRLVEARFQLGNDALESGDLEVALKYLQEAAAANGEVPAKVHYALSRAWRRAGDTERATASMRRFDEQKKKEQP